MPTKTKTKADLIAEIEAIDPEATGLDKLTRDDLLVMAARIADQAEDDDTVVDGEAVEIIDGDPIEATPAEADALIAAEATQEVVLRERDTPQHPVHALPSPGEWEATMTMAATIAATPFVPTAYRGQPEAVVAAILYGREIGIGPMQALRQIHMIDGKPALSAELMMAQMRRGGLIVLHSESTRERAWIHAKRQDTGEEAEVEWTLAEAQTIPARERGNNITLAEKGTWQSYPADMLWARCVGRLARRLGSDLLGGMVYSSEEVLDWDEGDYGGHGYTTPSRAEAAAPASSRPTTTDGVELRADAPLGWGAINAAMKAIDEGGDWAAWVAQAMTARVGKGKLADLTDDESRDVGIRVANGVARLVETLAGRDFPPPSRDEVQAAFAAADSIDVKLLGPDGPMGPDEAAMMQAARDARQERAADEGQTGQDAQEAPEAAETPSEAPAAPETASDAPLAGPTPPPPDPSTLPEFGGPS